jgi:hypothetical protein
VAATPGPTRIPASDPSVSLVDSPAQGTRASSVGDEGAGNAGEAADTTNSSSSMQSEGLRHFEWTPLNIMWAGGTLLVLIVLAASPGVRDRWRSRAR